MNCKTCAAFVPAGLGSKQGTCRRNAPVPILLGMQQVAPPAGLIGGMSGQPMQQMAQPIVQGFFPLVSEDIWCLEYRQREQVAEQPQPAA